MTSTLALPFAELQVASLARDSNASASLQSFAEQLQAFLGLHSTYAELESLKKICPFVVACAQASSADGQVGALKFFPQFQRAWRQLEQHSTVHSVQLNLFGCSRSSHRFLSLKLFAARCRAAPEWVLMWMLMWMLTWC